MISSQEICNYTRGKGHNSFLQDIIHVRLGNMNPCHPLCFFSYFLHEESICFVEAQEVLPEYLLPLALALTTIVVKQHTIVYLNTSNLVHVSTLSPTSPTPCMQYNQQLICTLTQKITNNLHLHHSHALLSVFSWSSQFHQSFKSIKGCCCRYTCKFIYQGQD